MKKSTLFVLLLAAVFLFMTACNPATNEPAATDDPTSIPGVTEDPNVPSKDKLVPAKPEDINTILSALSSINNIRPNSITIEASSKYTNTYSNAEVTLPGSAEKSTVNGTITSQESKPVDSDTFTRIYNGELTVDKVKYTFNNFTVATNDKTTSYSGQCIIGNNKNPNDYQKAEVESLIQYLSRNADNEQTTEYGNLISKLNYNRDTVKGNISGKVTANNSNKSTIVVMVDLELGKEKVPTTAKYIINVPSDFKGDPSGLYLSIEYASFKGEYYTEESLLKSEVLMATLKSFAFSLFN